MGISPLIEKTAGDPAVSEKISAYHIDMPTVYSTYIAKKCN